jgi:hypothetical protein
MVQTVLPVLRAAAPAIPVAGPLLQAAIDVLLSILQTIDVRACLITRMFLDLNAITDTQSEQSGP